MPEPIEEVVLVEVPEEVIEEEAIQILEEVIAKPRRNTI